MPLDLFNDALRQSLEFAARGRAIAAFPNVSCSQCGQSFGPGDHGYSSCDRHAPRLNDDDVYVVDLRTKSVVREIGAASASARTAGVLVFPGQALVKGMQARMMGLVS